MTAENTINIEAEKQIYNDIDYKIARIAHESWRRDRLSVEASKQTSPLKQVKIDKKWIEEHHGIMFVDISAVDFDSLPWDYQRDNLRSAHISAQELTETLKTGFDPYNYDKYVEDTAAKVQRTFRADRKSRGIALPSHQDMDYANMDEQTKDFDRTFPLLTLEVYINYPHLFASTP